MYSWLLLTGTALAVDRNVPATYATINLAITASQSGDRIVLAPGQYDEDLSFPAMSLTLVGAGMDQSVLRNGEGTVLIWVPTGADIVLEDLTLTTGSVRRCIGSDGAITVRRVRMSGCADIAGNGGALQLQTNGTALIEDSILDQNEASRGAHIYAYGQALVIRGSTLTRGTGTFEGGVYHTGGGPLTIEGTRFADNTAGSDGGAVSTASGGAVTIVDSVFERNHAPTGQGGALFAYASEKITISGTAFTSNTAYRAAALDVSNTVGVAMTRSVLCDNEGGGSIGGGGAVRFYASDATLSNVVFHRNRATVAGSAVYLHAASATVDFATIVDNDPGAFGTLFAVSGSDLQLKNSVLVGTPGGYGVWTDASSAWTAGINLWDANLPDHLGGELVASDLNPMSLVNVGPSFQAWTDDCATAALWPAQQSPLEDAADPLLRDWDGTAADLGAWGGLGPLCELVARHPDADGDGFGDPSIMVRRCDPVDGEVNDASDCDDTDADVGLGVAYYPDADNDGYGALDATEAIACFPPPGTADRGGDCDDMNGTVHPGATEVNGDNVDQDCDGIDGTAGSTNPQAPPSDRAVAVARPAPLSSVGCGCGGGPLGSLWLLTLTAVAVWPRRPHQPPTRPTPRARTGQPLRRP